MSASLASDTSSRGTNCTLERERLVAEDGDCPSNPADNNVSHRPDTSCPSATSYKSSSERKHPLKRSKSDSDLDDVDRTTLGSAPSPPKKPRIAVERRKEKHTRRHKVRFAPDTIDNEPWQDLFEAKYFSERPSKHARVREELTVSEETPMPHGARTTRPTDVSTKNKCADTDRKVVARTSSSVTFYDIVSPYMRRPVSQEEHTEANAVLSRIRAQLSEEDDELLQDALGKLCKVECGKVWLICRKQPPSAT